MKRLIYLLFALLMACQKDVIDVRDFGKVTIDSISPATGPAGTYVLVHGYNFTYLASDAKAFINNAEVRIVKMGLDSMILQIPEGAVTGELTFTFNRKNPTGGYDYSQQVDAAATGPVFTVDAAAIPAPIVSAVLPANGKAGAEITLNGYNFSDGHCHIFFGDTEGTITAITGTQVKVKVPKITPGKVALRVSQGAHTVHWGEFTVDETPAGVKEIFWTTNGTVEKAVFDEDGNPVIATLYNASDNVFVYPSGLTIDQNKGRVYFMEVNKVYAGSLDGSTAPTLVYTAPETMMLMDIALDSRDRLYITGFDASWSGNNKIVRVNTDGTGAEELYRSADKIPGGLKIDETGGKMYWIDIMAMAVYESSIADPATATLLYDANSGINAPTSLALDDANLYIVDGNTTAIMVAPKDGSAAPQKLPIPMDVLMGVSDVELDAANGYLYWMVWDFQVAKGTMFRCKTDGTGVQRVIEGMPEAYQLSVML